MARRSVLASFGLLGVLVGCAGADGPDPAAAVDQAEAEATSMRWYSCSGSTDFDSMNRLEVGISARKLKVVDLSKDAAPPDSGNLDPSYRPTPAFAGAIRYSGFPVITDLWDDVGSVDFIVSKELQDRPAQGKIFMRTAGSGGGSTTSYFCKQKDKPLAVDTRRRSRLMCEFGLLCTDDNPPGSTCLSSGFVNQTADDGSTMKTTILDHFGVHIQERTENLGFSRTLARTSKKFEAEWARNKLDLDYRGGVTYTGTFTLADGRSTSATCNDLAMLD
jgi:hypothetical protein